MKSFDFRAKTVLIFVQKLVIVIIFVSVFYIYRSIGIYGSFLKLLWDFTDDIIWLATQNLNVQNLK